MELVCDSAKCEKKIPFKGLHVMCGWCANKYCLDCIYLESGVQTLLRSFGIIVEKDGSLRTVPDKLCDDTQYVLQRCFGRGKAFEYICHKCKCNWIQKERSMSDTVNQTEQRENNNEGNVSAAGETNHEEIHVDNIPLTEMVFNHITESNTTGFYQIHLSKFNVKTSKKQIETHIITNDESIHANEFEIMKMGRGERSRLNQNSFSTFKLVTKSKDVYDKLLEPSLWAPDFTARPFTSERSNNVRRNNNIEHGRNNYIDRYRSHPNHRNEYRRNEYHRNEYRRNENRRNENHRNGYIRNDRTRYRNSNNENRTFSNNNNSRCHDNQQNSENVQNGNETSQPRHSIQNADYQPPQIQNQSVYPTYQPFQMYQPPYQAQVHRENAFLYHPQMNYLRPMM